MEKASTVEVTMRILSGIFYIASYANLEADAKKALGQIYAKKYMECQSCFSARLAFYLKYGILYTTARTFSALLLKMSPA